MKDKKPLLCKLKIHLPLEETGTTMTPGIKELYCSRCGEYLGSKLPFGNFYEK
jgi:hypothetical protein